MEDELVVEFVVVVVVVNICNSDVSGGGKTTLFISFSIAGGLRLDRASRPP